MKKVESSEFFHHFDVFTMVIFNLICIFDFKGQFKKLNNFEQSEINFFLLFSPCPFIWYMI